MKKLRISKIWIAVVVIVIVAVAAWAMSGGKKEEDINFKEEKVALKTLQNSVTATGTIEAVTSVTVGTQVSGIVNKLYVDYNSQVKKGQVIAELDKTNLLSELNTAKANLASAQSSLNYQTANMERYKTLYKKGLVSADEYENALLTYRQAKEQVASSKENVQRAQTNLGYATITSPIDGTVISKSVEEGQTVAASFNTPELFTIAKDLTNMQVVANVDEADIGGVKEGDRVTFTVDAYPDDTFEGTVKQVRLEATTTNNVVTYEVVISAPNADLKLKPGLTANVTIYTQERSGVLAVANKALRFTPTKETVGKDMKIVDCKGKNKVWTLNGNTLTAHPVTIGQSDGINTEITKGLKQGDKIVTEIVVNVPEEEDAPHCRTERSCPAHPGAGDCRCGTPARPAGCPHSAAPSRSAGWACFSARRCRGWPRSAARG